MGNEIAGVIIEPVAGNMGVVPPKDGYLQKIREITKKVRKRVYCGRGYDGI